MSNKMLIAVAEGALEGLASGLGDYAQRLKEEKDKAEKKKIIDNLRETLRQNGYTYEEANLMTGAIAAGAPVKDALGIVDDMKTAQVGREKTRSDIETDKLGRKKTQVEINQAEFDLGKETMNWMFDNATRDTYYQLDVAKKKADIANTQQSTVTSAATEARTIAETERIKRSFNPNLLPQNYDQIHALKKEINSTASAEASTLMNDRENAHKVARELWEEQVKQLTKAVGQIFDKDEREKQTQELVDLINDPPTLEDVSRDSLKNDIAMKLLHDHFNDTTITWDDLYQHVNELQYGGDDVLDQNSNRAEFIEKTGQGKSKDKNIVGPPAPSKTGRAERIKKLKSRGGSFNDEYEAVIKILPHVEAMEKAGVGTAEWRDFVNTKIIPAIKESAKLKGVETNIATVLKALGIDGYRMSERP